MAKVYVSRTQLRALFHQYEVWDGLRGGAFSYGTNDKVIIPVKLGHWPPGGVQLYHKWKDALGRHVVTTHMVLDIDGWPVHWDEKDLIIGEIKYIHRASLDPEQTT